jgi:myo-inositol-1(or 4)-monophosphatase
MTQPAARRPEKPEDLARCLTVAERAARAAGALLQEYRGKARVSAKGPRDLVTEADILAQECVRSILLESFPTHRFVGEEAEPLPCPPAVPAISSEGDSCSTGGSPTWIVDPLDGTTNYVHGYPAYCVSIALAEHDRLLVGVIHDPVAGETYTATRGGGAWRNGSRLAVSSVRHAEDALVSVSFPAHPTAEAIAVKDFLAVLPHVQAVRRSGSTALNLAWLAAGRLDAFWVRRIRSWDVAAGLLLVREAGGTVVDFAWDGRRQPGDVPLDEPAFIAGATADLVRRILQWLPPSGERAAPPSGGLPSD